MYGLGRALRYTCSKQKKNSQKSNFLLHGPEIFGVNAAFMAAHFPPQGCLGSESNEWRYFPETAETTPSFRKVNA